MGQTSAAFQGYDTLYGYCQRNLTASYQDLGFGTMVQVRV